MCSSSRENDDPRWGFAKICLTMFHFAKSLRSVAKGKNLTKQLPQKYSRVHHRPVILVSQWSKYWNEEIFKRNKIKAQRLLCVHHNKTSNKTRVKRDVVDDKRVQNQHDFILPSVFFWEAEVFSKYSMAMVTIKPGRWQIVSPLWLICGLWSSKIGFNTVQKRWRFTLTALLLLQLLAEWRKVYNVFPKHCVTHQE